MKRINILGGGLLSGIGDILANADMLEMMKAHRLIGPGERTVNSLVRDIAKSARQAEERAMRNPPRWHPMHGGPDRRWYGPVGSYLSETDCKRALTRQERYDRRAKRLSLDSVPTHITRNAGTAFNQMTSQEAA